MAKQKPVQANKLNTEARTLVKQWIVMGLTNGEIRQGLGERGYADDLTDNTFTVYRQDPQVQADAEAVAAVARQQGMASRYRRIGRVHEWLMETHHRIKGTTPRKDNPDLADAQVEAVSVDNATYKQLIDAGVKLLAEMSRLVDLPTTRTATIVRKDTQGNITGSATIETQTIDPNLRRISTLAQANDAMEALLTMLEAEEQQATPSEGNKGLVIA